jgi:hypothetical protein
MQQHFISSLFIKKKKKSTSHYFCRIKTIHRLVYLFLLLLSTVNNHSSWSSSLICDNNENVFIKRIQPGSFYWNSCRFGQGCNRKFNTPARSVTALLQICWHFKKGKKYIKLDPLFFEQYHSNLICSAYSDILWLPFTHKW